MLLLAPPLENSVGVKPSIGHERELAKQQDYTHRNKKLFPRQQSDWGCHAPLAPAASARLPNGHSLFSALSRTQVNLIKSRRLFLGKSYKELGAGDYDWGLGEDLY
jgi:hypothetical protein